MNRILLTLIALLTITGIKAQDITTVEATNQDISDNLDLEAVANIFGESKDLEDFELRLNDPEARISNLDLNQDGYVDYLRVIETAMENAHLITIQAVLGEDLYQDVATIDVEQDANNTTRVQVIGDVYMYGSNYIIEPVYVTRPVIYSWFWGPRWNVWVSPWYYGYYPNYWRRWNTFSYQQYYTHIHTHYVHVHHVYHYTNVRRSNHCLRMHRQTRRGDFHRKSPESSFASRHQKIGNKHELDQNRGIKPISKPIKDNTVPATGKEVRKDWKSETTRSGKPSAVRGNKVVLTKDSSKPISKEGTVSKKTTREATKTGNYQPKKESRTSNTKAQSPTRQLSKENKPQTRPASRTKSSPAQRSQTRPAPKTQTRSTSSSSKKKTASSNRSTPKPSASRSKSTSKAKSPAVNRSTPKKSSSGSRSNLGKRK